MYGWRGIASGALALVVLSVVVTPAAASRVGGVADFVVTLARHFLDPTVPAIPERAAAAPAPSIPNTPGAPPPSGTAPGVPFHGQPA